MVQAECRRWKLNAGQHNVIVLFGQRRVGKTSLLRQIFRRLKDGGEISALQRDLDLTQDSATKVTLRERLADVERRLGEIERRV